MDKWLHPSELGVRLAPSGVDVRDYIRQWSSLSVDVHSLPARFPVYGLAFYNKVYQNYLTMSGPAVQVTYSREMVDKWLSGLGSNC